MPASKKTLAEYFSVAVFTAALGYFVALSQLKTEISSRLAVLEERTKKVPAIYDALVRRGLITAGADNGFTQENAGAVDSSSAQTPLAIVDSVGRCSLRCGRGAAAGGETGVGAGHRSRGQGAGYRVGDGRCTPRDRAALAAIGAPCS